MVPGKGDIDVAGVVDYRRTDFSCRDARRFFGALSLLQTHFNISIISVECQFNSTFNLTLFNSNFFFNSRQSSSIQHFHQFGYQVLHFSLLDSTPMSFNPAECYPFNILINIHVELNFKSH